MVLFYEMFHLFIYWRIKILQNLSMCKCIEFLVSSYVTIKNEKRG